MDKFVIKGPNRLSGTVTADGSKNAALPIIAGSLLVEKGETVISNIPPLRDIFTIQKMLEHFGAIVTYDPDALVMTINAETITNTEAPYELMRQMRASFLVLGPLLARTGEASVSLPGGCSLGSRPVDYHIKGFKAMGAEITEESGFVKAVGKPLRGGAVYFDRPSHTGTENLIYAAIFAEKATCITNAACDPEVVDFVNYLNKAGARIAGAGTPNIVIEPVKQLHAVEFTVSGDRLVAGTMLIGAAMTGGEVRVTGVDPTSLTMLMHKMREMGAETWVENGAISVKGPKKLKGIEVTTFPFPGFPTDLQACIMAAATISRGTSHIKETVFIDRFSHSMELRRLGAEIRVSGDEAIIDGVDSLSAAAVMAPDIRAGAGIVLACLVAEGESEVSRVYHIDRGYARLEQKLLALGADIKRISE